MSILTSTLAPACSNHVINLKTSLIFPALMDTMISWAGCSSLLEAPRQAPDPPLTPTTSVPPTSQAPDNAEAKKPGEARVSGSGAGRLSEVWQKQLHVSAYARESFLP